MAVDADIDVDLLKSEIKKTYASVSTEPEKDFIFPTGRPWAEDLGYPAELANVPESAVQSFAGVANPWQLGRLTLGERVLDLGSGAGTDSLVAALLLGLGTALVYPTLIAAVSDATQPRERARTVGVYRFWRDFGFVAGALIAGFATDAASPKTAIATVAALTAASGLVVAATRWQSRPALTPAPVR